MTERGPDYAADLSTSEQQTLDLLLARVGPRRRRGTGVPLAAGVTAAVIVCLVVSAITGVRTSGHPVGVAGPTPLSTFDQLAAAADRAASTSTATTPGTATGAPGTATTPPPRSQKSLMLGELDQRHAELRLEILVDNEAADCTAYAIAVDTRPAMSPDWPAPLIGGTLLSRLSPPSDLSGLAGCTPSWSSPQPPAPMGDTLRYRKDIPTGWQELLARIPDLRGLPPYADPRALADQVAISSIDPTPDDVTTVLNGLVAGYASADRTAGWWTLWVDLIASPYTTATQRAAGLRAAARKASSEPNATGLVTAVDAPDVTGRPGIAAQVPYLRHGTETTTKLTFDSGTGELLQRVVYESLGQSLRCEITVMRVTDNGTTTAWVRDLPGG